jgi:type IV pilus assembly protein PilM
VNVAGRSAVGLDIGTSGIRAAEVTTRKGQLTLERFGQVALPPGAVRAGEVVDPATVTLALKQLWKTVGFSSRNVVLGVANAKVIVRQVDLPWLPPAEMRKALRFQVQDFLPMDINDAVLDFHPLVELTGADGGRTVRGLLVAASRDMVNGLLTAVRKAGLHPSQVDLTSFAVLRSVGRVDHLGTTDHVEALIDIGASVTNVVVHANGIPRFVRLLLQGGADITEALADRLGVSLDEAEALKRGHGGKTEASSTQEDVAVHAIGRARDDFVDEIRRSLEYYVTTAAAERIDRVVLSGGGAQLHDLESRLAAATSLPVELGRGFASLSIGKTGLSDDQLDVVGPSSAVPVGLALGALT